MMYERRIPDPDNNAFFNFIHDDDFEYAKPEAKLTEQFLFANMGFRKKEAYWGIPPALVGRMTPNDVKAIMLQVLKLANQDTTEEINRLKSMVLPAELLSIFSGLKKKDEEKLFNNFLLTPEMFIRLLLHADHLDYKYSRYTFIQNPAGINS
jgi:hypothetical protein